MAYICIATLMTIPYVVRVTIHDSGIIRHTHVRTHIWTHM